MVLAIEGNATMPNLNFTISVEKAAELLEAAEFRLERLDGETDLELIKRFIRRLTTIALYRYKSQIATESVVPDNDLIEDA